MKIDEKNEVTLWRGRPSLWNWWLQLCIADLLIILAAALWWADQATWIPAALAASVLIYICIGIARYGELFLVTSQRVIAVRGLLSRHVDEVEVRDIRNIKLKQTFTQRLLGIGNIGVASAGGDGVEVRFGNIAEAHIVKEKIRHVRLKGKELKKEQEQPALPGLAAPHEADPDAD
jgi:uncharacterized membrane protein YdbT with pleckstrin-like domain